MHHAFDVDTKDREKLHGSRPVSSPHWGACRRAEWGDSAGTVGHSDGEAEEPQGITKCVTERELFYEGRLTGSGGSPRRVGDDRQHIWPKDGKEEGRHENDRERPLEGVTVRTAEGAAIGALH